MVNLNSVAAAGNAGQTASSRNSLGQEDFLKLMLAQLRNQDPFSPMESGEQLTQIAQFTAATGIQEMQKSFERFSQNSATQQALQAASLVGRTVLVESDTAYLSSDGSLTATLDVPMRLNNCQVAIYAESGELVREIGLGALEPGQVEFSWDGTDSKGNPLPPGRYHIAASTTIDGQDWLLTTYTSAEVQGVTLGVGGAAPTLTLADIGEVSLSSVTRIR